MQQADPEFGKELNQNSIYGRRIIYFYLVLGRALALGLELLATSSSIHVDTKLKTNVEELQALAAKKRNEITDREQKHVDAVIKWSIGDMVGATNVWEDILVDHPTDIHALRMAHDTYFYLGYQNQMRDSLARVIPIWEKNNSLPLKWYEANSN